jgi:quercetin dioxygenase-like cupin family protein
MSKPSSIAEGAVFDLAVVDRELRTEDAYHRDGHTARTLVREAAMRVVLVVMKAGAKIAQHKSHDTASIHAVSGHIRLALAGQVVELPAGQLLVIPPDLPHDVEAVVESRFLITLAPRGDR